MLVILLSQEAEIRRIKVLRQPREIVCETLSQKYPTQSRTGRLGCLPNKHEAMSSSSSTTKKTKKKFLD
jgi:hypothetical protein